MYFLSSYRGEKEKQFLSCLFDKYSYFQIPHFRGKCHWYFRKISKAGKDMRGDAERSHVMSVLDRRPGVSPISFFGVTGAAIFNGYL